MGKNKKEIRKLADSTHLCNSSLKILREKRYPGAGEIADLIECFKRAQSPRFDSQHSVIQIVVGYTSNLSS